MAYLLGLDAGNTVIKAVVFDEGGTALAVAALDGESHVPRPGHVERDLDELWSNAKTVIARAVTEAGIDASQIAAIGCAGHGNGLYCLDRDDQPLIAIQSIDTRAVDLVEEWAASGMAGKAHAICLQSPWVSQTPTLLAWLKRHRRALYDRVGTVFLCKDFVNFKLTGAKRSDISDMSGCGFLAMPGAAYDDDLLALYGLSDVAGALPELCDPTDIIGRVGEDAAAVTGLAAGTPVVGGLFDVVASALGSGVVEEGSASIIAGTWSINQVISSRVVAGSDVFMASTFGPGRFIEIDASATSAANLEWTVRELIEDIRPDLEGAEAFALCNDLIADIEPDADLPLYLPFLYGAGGDPRARAGYIGLAGWHKRKHMLYALFEGVAFEHRVHVEKLKNAGLDFSNAALSGGGSRSPVWPRMFADCLGLPLTVSLARETGALGGAIAAGVGAGIFATLEDGVAAMAATSDPHLPDPARQAAHDKRFALYLDLKQRLAPLWPRFSPNA